MISYDYGRSGCRYVAGIGDALEPPRQPSIDWQQLAATIYGSAIDCALQREVIGGSGYEDIIADEGHC
jgi:hypothetical protein